MAGPNPTRADDLDLLKTLLVIGMIGAHVIQLITFGPKREAMAFADYANLVSFSGFMFAFGIGLGLPKPKRVRPLAAQLRPVLLLLGSVYLSSLAFALLVDRQALTADLLLDVFTMRRLFGWSEFLATFFMLSVIILVARAVLLAIGRHPWLLVAACALCLVLARFKTDAILPLLPTLVSQTAFPNFPLVAYLPWVLIGIWYGSHPLRPVHFIPALLATGWLAQFFWRAGGLPDRFPPSTMWLVGPAAILLAYLGLSRWIAARVRIPALLLTPGRHVLSFLVLSNLAFFTIRHVFNKPVRGTPMVALATFGVLAVLTLGWALVERHTTKRKALAPAKAPAPSA